MKNLNNKSILKNIRKAKTIFLMAHKKLDLDALGSIIGFYEIIRKKRKNCYIIIDEKDHESGVDKVLKELTGCLNIIKSTEIEDNKYPRERKNLLLILDTNKRELVQSEKALDLINKQIIIDHHNIGSTTLKKPDRLIRPDVSSTCEILTEIIENNDIELDPYYATVILAGIVLDTNNFTLKTSKETYYSAYYLSCLGASASKVQYLLKQDIEEYKEREKLLTNIETVNKKIAITKASPYSIYRKEELAKCADTLLFFNNIEASFVIGKISKEEIGISARSLGEYDINSILSHFKGGGDDYHGAATIKETKISTVLDELKEILKKEG